MAESPLTIVIGADTFPPNVNGAATFGQNLASGMAARGHNVHVVAPAASSKHGTWQETHGGQTFTVHRLKSWRWYPHDWLRFALPWRIRQNSAKILDEVRPDVVHFQSHIVTGRGLSQEAEKRGIRIIGTNHFMPENLLAFTLIPPSIQDRAIALAWRAARRTFGRAQAVTTPTVRAAEFLEQYTGLRNVLPISCGIDASQYTPDFAPRTENRIIFVGRVTGEKHIDVLINAVEMLPTDLDVKVDIIGGGDQLKNLEQLSAHKGLAERITFHGYVSDEELRSVLTRGTVFAMPSVAELQSIATMEAMATGLPIVAANAMALPHLVTDGVNGYLFEPGNAIALAAALERVLRLPQAELDAFKRASLEGIMVHDIERTMATFERLYRGDSVDEIRAAQSAARDSLG